MKFETLKQNRRKKIVIGLVFFIAVISTLSLVGTRAKYRTTQSIKIVEGSISYKPYDFKIMAMYQENDSGAYEEIEIMPTSGYVINEKKSYCTIDNINKDNNVVLETMNGNHIVSNLKQNEKCYVWFDKVSTIQNIIETHNLTIRSDFSTTLTTDTTGTLFMAPDDYGTSYYYAGAVQDNWVKFAGFYWRIIRINGDGTLRMIYSGTEESGPATTGEATTIGTSAFNSNWNNNAYEGFMYTIGAVHGNETDSTIKGILDTWYNNNLASYASNIAIGSGATFCNDRQPSTSNTILNGSGGTGTTETYYAGYIRLITNKVPTFKCADSSDRLNISIGLITADEVAYAGGVHKKDNGSYYLCTWIQYLTMTPSVHAGSASSVFEVVESGWIYDINVHLARGVRPVISLTDVTTFSSGDGTSSNPYVIS